MYFEYLTFFGNIGITFWRLLNYSNQNFSFIILDFFLIWKEVKALYFRFAAVTDLEQHQLIHWMIAGTTDAITSISQQKASPRSRKIGYKSLEMFQNPFSSQAVKPAITSDKHPGMSTTSSESTDVKKEVIFHPVLTKIHP